MKKIFMFLLVTVLLLASFMTAQAQTPSGVGVIGDSQSRPYRCAGYGNSTSFNWVEYGRMLRGLDFGPGTTCASYVKAWAGYTVQLNMASQTTSLLVNINAGQIQKVFIMLGHNDVNNPNPAPGLVNTILGIYETQLDRILSAGILPQNVLMVGVMPSTYPPTQANLSAFNSGLQNLASVKGTNYMPFPLTVKIYTVGGEIINVCYNSADYHCLFLGPQGTPGYGHTGTVGNGLLFNEFAWFFGVTPLSDAEILAFAQGGSIATATSAPAATATPSRTPTSTPVVTLTPVWNLIDCSPLSLVFEQLTASSGRWRCE